MKISHSNTFGLMTFIRYIQLLINTENNKPRWLKAVVLSNVS